MKYAILIVVFVLLGPLVVDAGGVPATQFIYMAVYDSNHVLHGYYIILGTGEAWLYTDGSVKVVFNNGTVVAPPSGLYDYTNEDIVVQLASNSTSDYVKLNNYTFSDPYISVDYNKTANAALVAGVLACGYVNVQIATNNSVFIPSVNENNTIGFSLGEWLLLTSDLGYGETHRADNATYFKIYYTINGATYYVIVQVDTNTITLIQTNDNVSISLVGTGNVYSGRGVMAWASSTNGGRMEIFNGVDYNRYVSRNGAALTAAEVGAVYYVTGALPSEVRESLNVSLMGCSTWYAWGFYSSSDGGVIEANITASDWQLQKPKANTVTVTTTTTTTVTSKTTYTQTVTVAPPTATVGEAGKRRTLLLGAGVAAVVLLALLARR